MDMQLNRPLLCRGQTIPFFVHLLLRTFVGIAALLVWGTVLSAQQPHRVDFDAVAKQTGVFGIAFEASNGFQLFHPDRRLKANVRLNVDEPAFVSWYLKHQPLAPAIDAEGAMQIARALVQQAIQHRHNGELQAAYFLYRFALANLVGTEDVAGLDIVTHNVWALRSATQVREWAQPGTSKPLQDLVRADAAVLHQLLAADPRYTPAAVEQDTSLRRIRILRRVADLAGHPTGFSAHAARLLATDMKAIPIGWIAPAAEELASRDLIAVLTAEGQIPGDKEGLSKIWQLYEALRPRLHEAGNVGELSFILDFAKQTYTRMRGQAVAGGGTLGHSISMFAVSKYLQAFGRDLTTLMWKRGSREQALGLAEGMQARAVTDWLARSHPSNRLKVRAGVTGSVGEITPASVQEIRDLARRKERPILFYFKAADAYLLWAILPDGQMETAELKFGPADLAELLQIFPFGSEASPVASSTRGRSRTGGDAAAGAGETAAKQKLLADLRRKVVPDQVLQRLRPYSKLHIVADGLINYVPFAALTTDQGKYFVDHFALQLSPAITTTLVLEGSSAVRKATRVPSSDTVIALPSQQDTRTVTITVAGETRPYQFEPLAGAEEETKRVAALLKGKISTEMPTRSRAYLPVLHFATHGFYDVERPLASFLILQHGKLTAEQLYFGQMHIPTGLVVLSACQTGLGFAHPDSLIGLRNGFLVAGAQSVLGTLWIISDDATLELMDAFYRSMLGGAPLDEALRQAQVALKARPEFADPYFWAAFQLVGLESNPL
jgi:CHAT domain